MATVRQNSLRILLRETRLFGFILVKQLLSMADIGIQGVELEDKQPLTDEDKKQMFLDIINYNSSRNSRNSLTSCLLRVSPPEKARRKFFNEPPKPSDNNPFVHLEVYSSSVSAGV